MASSSSSNSNFRWKYDVFLSFRGKDTRTGFIDHLYAALNRAGMYVFRDDIRLQSGEEIGPELRKAMDESRMSLVVLSQNYADSTWCLNELVHILASKKTLGHAVFPVFYDIDPSHVRSQRGSFVEAFARHEERFKYDMDKVKRWRDALTQVASFSGWVVRKFSDGHESKIIDKIVMDILNRLNRTKLSVTNHPVGLSDRAYEVICMLRVKSLNVCIVGIYGIGGLGKTEIAKDVYNSMYDQFDASCFLANVRENSDPKGMVKLQRQLLSETLMGKHEKIHNVDRGRMVIEERLCHKRVLLVLDDIDHKQNQLDKLLGDLRWLFPGSRVIITTRIEGLLKTSPLYKQYEVQQLDYKESLQLLSLHAFDMVHPEKDYMECAQSVVRYAGGLPLVLEVLGSSLYGEHIDVWHSTLKRLQAISEETIHTRLKISYDVLDDAEKSLFLDIACFFVGFDKDYIISILDGVFPIDGISKLVKRCLIRIDYHNKLMMHDLLRDMGREIVRREYPEEPENRTRLWRHEDVIDVVTDKTGTKAVQGLILNLSAQSQIFNTEAFQNMSNLRLLQLNYVHLTGSFEKFSRKLKWLCWHEFQLGSVPDDLRLGNLVALDMRYSKLKQLPKKFQAPKLKFLNLSHSHMLTKILSFEGFSNLEKLKLKDCVSLVELPESICTLRSVKNLDISGCSKLKDLPEDFGNMESLVKLVADRTSISKLPETFGRLNKLRNLSFCECPLKGLSIISALLGLVKLDLRHCNLTDEFFPHNLDCLSGLEELKLCGNNFSSLPATITSLTNLHTLWLSKCERLKSAIKLSSRLKSFIATDCPLLEIIDITHVRLNLDFGLDGCPKLKVVEGLFNLEPTEVETVEKLLGILTPDTANLFNRFTDTATIGLLQALSQRGIYSIFLPFKEIPSWFSYQKEGDNISLHVPPFEQGHKIMGFIICTVYAWGKFENPSIFTPQIRVSNRTKMFDWFFDPKVACFQRKVQHDITWLSYWMFDKLHPFINEPDMSWRFQDEMQAGDHIDVSIHIGKGISVKKCGIHLLYWQSSQSDELAMISRASLRHKSKFSRIMEISDEVNLPVNVLPVSFLGHDHGQAVKSPDALPKTVTRTLNLGSSPTSMDFHPVQQTLLLVGTNVGDIGLWEVGSRERLGLKNFKVWDVSTCSIGTQAFLANDPVVSVNRVIWSPDGSLFGVAYSMYFVQVYCYHGNDDVRQHLEIQAHNGGVNDLAFSHPNKQLSVITCGDDKTIKVWDAYTGARQYTFEGHEAPVYSVCPHYKENIQFIFSTDLDGKINKAWLYDNLGSRIDYDAPGRLCTTMAYSAAPGYWCTTMAYSADGTRLFSCGTSKDGESYIVEWNESEGFVKRTYEGFRKRSLGVVQFDTTKNRFLAAGDDFSIKFWDMDNVQLLTSIDADGGLSASPRIRFNKAGTLLAVSTNEEGIKILANSDGIQLLRTFENLSNSEVIQVLRTFENLSYDASRASKPQRYCLHPKYAFLMND